MNSKNITLHGGQYTFLQQGTGNIPCLCIGIGTLLQRTLSERFKKLFTVYAGDSYFVEVKNPINAEKLSMTSLVEDVIATITQLGLERPVLAAHSCFGMVALEVAKNAPDLLRGVMLVASAPEWNANSIARCDQHFLNTADPDRIANDRERKAKYAKTRLPTDSEVSIGKYIADSARYWGNFHVTDAEILTLWEGISVDEKVINAFFERILPTHNTQKEMAKIKVPVINLASELDYDSLPLLLWENYPKPAIWEMINCGNVGHWPHLESQEVFDEAVQKWVNQHFK